MNLNFQFPFNNKPSQIYHNNPPPKKSCYAVYRLMRETFYDGFHIFAMSRHQIADFIGLSRRVINGNYRL